MLWKINFHKSIWIMKIGKLDIKNDYGWITLYFVLKLKFFIHKWIYLFAYLFAFTFWLFGKDGLIINLSLISKFITSQPGLQAIIIQVLPNISRSKGNQTTKLGQVIVYNKKYIFHQNSCWKWGKKISSRLLFVFFIKVVYDVKGSGLQLSLISLDSSQLGLQ